MRKNFSGRGNKRGSDAIKRAALTYAQVRRRVGTEPEAVGRWLIDLARRDLTKLTEEEWGKLKCEAAALCLVPKQYRAYCFPDQILQSWHRNLSERLLLLRDPREQRRRFLSLDGDSKYLAQLPALQVIEYVDCAVGFKFLVFRTLSYLGNRLRSCLNCRRLFVAHKRQSYCSPSCSQSTRMLRYRTNNREAFNKKRREYYRRSMQARFADQKVKIGDYGRKRPN